jgi:hypothetical protein
MNIEFEVNCQAHVLERWRVEVPEDFMDWDRDRKIEFLEELGSEGKWTECLYEEVDEERERDVDWASMEQA